MPRGGSRRLPAGFADGDAAREGEHADARVLRQVIADECAWAGQQVEAASWQSRLAEDVAEQGSCQRRGGGRLVDDGVAGRECRANLVGGEVDREVERRDGADDAERLADSEGELVLAARCTGERDRLSLEALGFFC